MHYVVMCEKKAKKMEEKENKHQEKKKREDKTAPDIHMKCEKSMENKQGKNTKELTLWDHIFAPVVELPPKWKQKKIEEDETAAILTEYFICCGIATPFINRNDVTINQVSLFFH